MDITKIIGLEGGNDGCFFKILAEVGRGETNYFPSFKNGEELTWDHPEYLKHKVTRNHYTIQVAVAGNPVCAEEPVSKILGCSTIAIGPGLLNIYPQEVINNG